MPILLSEDAQEGILRLPKVVRLRIQAMLAELDRWPAVSGVRPRRGNLAGWYRKRTGDYRVLFRVSGANIHVEKMGHRRDVYAERIMKRLPVIEIGGKRHVLVSEAEYERLVDSSRDRLPPLPPADANGYREALPFITVSIARDIIRERRAAGLSQQQLADAAGLRQETLSRIESGKHSPTVRTLKKIEAAMKKFTVKAHGKSASRLQVMK